MGVTRSRLSIDEQFTAVPNEWARDARLSRRARGLLVEVMSHRIGWHITIRSLAAAGKEGKDAIQSALQELVEHGYVRRSQARALAGKFGEIEYELCDPPTVSGFSGSGSAVSGSAGSGESATKKNIKSEDHLEEDQPEDLLSALADDASMLDMLPTYLDEIWQVWPTSRRTTRKVVEASLRTALKAAGWSTIIEAARAHSAVWATWARADHKYIPHLPTWLNQERWTGVVPEPRNGGSSTVDAGRDADAILAAQEQQRLAVSA